jgi:hypothetical protein
MADKEAPPVPPADIEYGGFSRFELELEVRLTIQSHQSPINRANSSFSLSPTETILLI